MRCQCNGPTRQEVVLVTLPEPPVAKILQDHHRLAFVQPKLVHLAWLKAIQRQPLVKGGARFNPCTQPRGKRKAGVVLKWQRTRLPARGVPPAKLALPLAPCPADMCGFGC